MISLVSQDDEKFQITYDIAKMSGLLNTILENYDNDQNIDDEIPIMNVKANILSKVIEFIKYYLEEPMKEIEKPLISSDMSKVVQQWYADFIKVDNQILFELILAANYLDIKPLLDLTCATTASMIKGKTPNEIAETFGIASTDIIITPEQEAKIREENLWCEEA
jgi:S-phase kinase-associated protein 1